MDFLDGLIGALASFAAQLERVVVFLLSIIINVFQFIWTVLQIVANFFLTLLKDVGHFFGHIWDSFFKGLFNNILRGVVRFGQWLHNIFGPVVRFLRKASQFIDRIYRRYARPILRWISIARVFLNLLRQLGIKWAAKLDSILGKVQHDIQLAFTTIKGYLNILIDLANILSDPTNLLRRPTTLLSLRRVLHAFIRQVTGLPPGFFIPSPSKFAPPGLGRLPANFNPADPLMNPPASYYLTLDSGVPSFEFLGPGETIDDSAVDDVGTLDFFNGITFEVSTCDDPVECMTQAAQAMLSREG